MGGKKVKVMKCFFFKQQKSKTEDKNRKSERSKEDVYATEGREDATQRNSTQRNKAQSQLKHKHTDR